MLMTHMYIWSCIGIMLILVVVDMWHLITNDIIDILSRLSLILCDTWAWIYSVLVNDERRVCYVLVDIWSLVWDYFLDILRQLTLINWIFPNIDIWILFLQSCFLEIGVRVISHITINRPCILTIHTLHASHSFSNWHHTDWASHLSVFTISWETRHLRFWRLPRWWHEQPISRLRHRRHRRRHAPIQLRARRRHAWMQLCLDGLGRAGGLNFRGRSRSRLGQWGQNQMPCQRGQRRRWWWCEHVRRQRHLPHSRALHGCCRNPCYIRWLCIAKRWRDVEVPRRRIRTIPTLLRKIFHNLSLPDWSQST